MRLTISFIGIYRWRCWLRSLGGEWMGLLGEIVAGAYLISRLQNVLQMRTCA